MRIEISFFFFGGGEQITEVRLQQYLPPLEAEAKELQTAARSTSKARASLQGVRMLQWHP